MSEIVNAPVRISKSRIIVLVLAGLSILLLLFVYGAGVIVLPALVLSNYQSKDCTSALTLNKVYTSLYPKILENSTLAASVDECKAYMFAVSQEKPGSWSEAFDAYQAYASKYPGGLYATEAHQQSGAALFHLAQEQIEQKKYEKALANLNLIVAQYSDTFVITDAWNLFPSVYTPWGVSLRETDAFESSERVLNEFKTWGLTNQKSDSATSAQRELTQTYLDWGLDLQSRTQYEDAIAKLDLATATDPDAQFDSAAQVKAGYSSVYLDWGNALLEQDEFPSAIEKFELAVAKADNTKAESAQEALVNGQIRWAQSLSTDEEFEAALEHLDAAKKAAASDALLNLVDTALQDTYLAFSKSTGAQARRAMKDIVETVCKNRKTPELPIFGLNQGSIQFGIYGAEDSLPQDLIAKTPDEMHYVACITADNQTVETRLHKNITFQFGRFAFYEMVEQFRVQVIWNVELREIATNKSLAKETLKGELPPPFAENAGNYFYGATPIDELVLWLQSVVK